MADEIKKDETTEEEVTDVEETTAPEVEDNSDADELRKEIQKLRKEAAKYRTGKKDVEEQTTALKEKLAKALGLKDDDADPDLSGEVKRLKDENRQERLKNAFYRAAQKAEADTDLMWAYLYANDKLSEIDVYSDDYEQTIAGEITAAIKSNPKLKANITTSNSGANPPTDPKKTVRDEYNETKEMLRKNPNDQALSQKLFILKSRLKE
jgi:hypothetical protein